MPRPAGGVALGRALDAHEARWPEAAVAIRLLALTGCRRSEVLNLRWCDIDGDAINLADSKTGPRAVPLGVFVVLLAAGRALAARHRDRCYNVCFLRLFLL